jgi:hypothetical protein
MAAQQKIAADAEGRSLKCRRRDGQKIIGRTERRRWKRRKVAHPLAARRAGRSCASTRVGHAGCFPAPDTRAVICNAASCAGVRSCGASGARVSAVSSRVSRPTARFIEYNCVLCPGRRRRCHADCSRLPSRTATARRLAVSAPACRHPSRPPLVWRIAKKSARESNLAR